MLKIGAFPIRTKYPKFVDIERVIDSMGREVERMPKRISRKIDAKNKKV